MSIYKHHAFNEDAETSKELTLDLSDDKTIDVIIYWQNYTDKNYGADRDGNRGTTMHYVDDIQFDFDTTGLTSDEINEINKQCTAWSDKNL